MIPGAGLRQQKRDKAPEDFPLTTPRDVAIFLVVELNSGARAMQAHVAVVDDNQAHAHAIGLILRTAGYRVSTAHYFAEALAILEASPAPNVLVTDLVMPGSVNGIALARMARLRDRAIRVIYITGYDIPGIEDEATNGPVLRKPFTDTRLLHTVAAELHAPVN